jgi:hypothetical protein
MPSSSEFTWPRLILYSKPGCHLCTGLEEKLHQIPGLTPNLLIRDIRECEEWWEHYQFEIPVLCWLKDEHEEILPRFSPRASVTQIERQLRQVLMGSR